MAGPLQQQPERSAGRGVSCWPFGVSLADPFRDLADGLGMGVWCVVGTPMAQELNRNLIEDGEALGHLAARHPRLVRLSLHGNLLNGAGGAELFRGVQRSRAAAYDDVWVGNRRCPERFGPGLEPIGWR